MYNKRKGSGAFRRSIQKIRNRQRVFEQLEPRLVLNSEWRNPVRSNDVNNDMTVSPMDALLVINAMQRQGSAVQLGPRDHGLNPYLDTSGDSLLSPMDVLRVINHMNRRDYTAGEYTQRIEGEAEPAPAGFISLVLAGLPGNSSQLVRAYFADDRRSRGIQ